MESISQIIADRTRKGSMAASAALRFKDPGLLLLHSCQALRYARVRESGADRRAENVVKQPKDGRQGIHGDCICSFAGLGPLFFQTLG